MTISYLSSLDDFNSKIKNLNLEDNLNNIISLSLPKNINDNISSYYFNIKKEDYLLFKVPNLNLRLLSSNNKFTNNNYSIKAEFTYNNNFLSAIYQGLNNPNIIDILKKNDYKTIRFNVDNLYKADMFINKFECIFEEHNFNNYDVTNIFNKTIGLHILEDFIQNLLSIEYNNKTSSYFIIPNSIVLINNSKKQNDQNIINIKINLVISVPYIKDYKIEPSIIKKIYNLTPFQYLLNQLFPSITALQFTEPIQLYSLVKLNTNVIEKYAPNNEKLIKFKNIINNDPRLCTYENFIKFYNGENLLINNDNNNDNNIEDNNNIKKILI